MSKIVKEINQMRFQKYMAEAYEIINEEIPQEGQALKSYAFDWDDNIQHLPTKIKLVDKDGNVKQLFSTEEFAKKRNDPKILKLITEQGYNWDYSNFRDDNEFFKDVESAKRGPAWDDFVEAINNASLIAIITARGHSVEAYKKVLYKFIISNREGINKEKILENIKEYRNAVGHEVKKLSDEQLIKKYVNQIKYYPVSNQKVASMLGGEGGAESPEKLKVMAINHFKSFVNKMHGILTKKIGNREIAIGFSDDDKKNVELMQKAKEDNPELKDLNIKYTG